MTAETDANPYSIYGHGNCVRFTYDCIDIYWEMDPIIPGSWDACQWTGLIGQEKDGYRIEQVDEPAVGDIFILPKSETYPLGHVGMIVGLSWQIWLNDGTYEICYRVIESFMYVTDEWSALEYHGCLYKYSSYWQEDFTDAVFLRCVPIID